MWFNIGEKGGGIELKKIKIVIVIVQYNNVLIMLFNNV